MSQNIHEQNLGSQCENTSLSVFFGSLTIGFFVHHLNLRGDERDFFIFEIDEKDQSAGGEGSQVMVENSVETKSMGDEEEGTFSGTLV